MISVSCSIFNLIFIFSTSLVDNIYLGLFFLIFSDNLCLWIGIFRWFTFQVIIGIVGLMPTMFVTVSCLLHLLSFLFPLEISAFCGFQWTFYMIPCYLSISSCTSFTKYLVIILELTIDLTFQTNKKKIVHVCIEEKRRINTKTFKSCYLWVVGLQMILLTFLVFCIVYFLKQQAGIAFIIKNSKALYILKREAELDWKSPLVLHFIPSLCFLFR